MSEDSGVQDPGRRRLLKAAAIITGGLFGINTAATVAGKIAGEIKGKEQQIPELNNLADFLFESKETNPDKYLEIVTLSFENSLKKPRAKEEGSQEIQIFSTGGKYLNIDTNGLGYLNTATAGKHLSAPEVLNQLLSFRSTGINKMESLFIHDEFSPKWKVSSSEIPEDIMTTIDGEAFKSSIDLGDEFVGLGGGNMQIDFKNGKVEKNLLRGFTFLKRQIDNNGPTYSWSDPYFDVGSRKDCKIEGREVDRQESYSLSFNSKNFVLDQKIGMKVMRVINNWFKK